eukprot:SAG11_NODE_5618_length_1506_cov_3.469083_1_plen_111_part_00
MLFYDGHDREDNVAYRDNEFIPEMQSLWAQVALWKAYELDDLVISKLDQRRVRLVTGYVGKKWMEVMIDDFTSVHLTRDLTKDAAVWGDTACEEYPQGEFCWFGSVDAHL